MITYRIPLAGIKQSTNKIYAGVYWATRQKIKDSVLGVAKIFCRPILRVDSYPVEIRYRFIFSSRALDTLNCAFMAKMLEDAFRALEILEDDDPKHVARSIIEVAMVPKRKKTKNDNDLGPQKIKKDEDYLEVEIKKTEPILWGN